MIPFVDLGAQYRSIQSDIDAAIADVIGASAFIRGPALERFERAFESAIGVRHAVGVASGTDALHLAVRALGIGPGDEVITQPNTWISTAFAASYVGAKPVFVDIDPGTQQIDAEQIEAAITPRTKAIIPVHLFGHPAPMGRIVEICRKRNLKIIEDVAQAPLAEVDGRAVGGIGDIACYSFYPSKNLGCFGDGGAVVTNDDALAARLREIAGYGQSGHFRHVSVGYNSRLDTMQAAVLMAKLPHLVRWTENRRLKAPIYRKILEDLPVRPLAEAPGAKSVHHLFVVDVDRREECLAFLRGKGIMAQVHYPTPIHLQPCYAELGYQAGSFPIAERAAGRILSLPFCAEITEASMRTVADALAEFFAV